MADVTPAEAVIEGVPGDAFDSLDSGYTPEPEQSKAPTREAPESTGPSDLEAFFSEEAKNYLDEEDAEPAVEEEDAEEELEASEEDKDSKEEAKPKESSRFEKRMQKQIALRKQAESQLGTFHQELTQLKHQLATQGSQWQQYHQQEVAKLAQERAVLARELELVRHEREAHEEQSLDPAERVKRSIEQRALELAKSEFSPQLEQLRKEQQQALAQFAEQRKAAERSERITAVQKATADAASSMLAELGDIAPKLQKRMETTILTYTAAMGGDPGERAKELDKFMHQYVLAKLQHKARGNKVKLEKGAAVPQASKSRKPATGKSLPSWSDIRAQGKTDYFDDI